MGPNPISSGGGGNQDTHRKRRQTVRRHREMFTATQKPRREAPRENSSATHLDLGFWKHTKIHVCSLRPSATPGTLQRRPPCTDTASHSRAAPHLSSLSLTHSLRSQRRQGSPRPPIRHSGFLAPSHLPRPIVHSRHPFLGPSAWTCSRVPSPIQASRLLVPLLTSGLFSRHCTNHSLSSSPPQALWLLPSSRPFLLS